MGGGICRHTYNISEKEPKRKGLIAYSFWFSSLPQCYSESLWYNFFMSALITTYVCLKGTDQTYQDLSLEEKKSTSISFLPPSSLWTALLETNSYNLCPLIAIYMKKVDCISFNCHNYVIFPNTKANLVWKQFGQ